MTVASLTIQVKLANDGLSLSWGGTRVDPHDGRRPFGWSAVDALFARTWIYTVKVVNTASVSWTKRVTWTYQGATSSTSIRVPAARVTETGKLLSPGTADFDIPIFVPGLGEFGDLSVTIDGVSAALTTRVSVSLGPDLSGTKTLSSQVGSTGYLAPASYQVSSSSVASTGDLDLAAWLAGKSTYRTGSTLALTDAAETSSVSVAGRNLPYPKTLVLVDQATGKELRVSALGPLFPADLLGADPLGGDWTPEVAFAEASREVTVVDLGGATVEVPTRVSFKSPDGKRTITLVFNNASTEAKA